MFATQHKKHRRGRSSGMPQNWRASRRFENLEERMYLSVEPSWALTIGDVGDDSAQELALDAEGNLYTTARISKDTHIEVSVLKHSPSGELLNEHLITRDPIGGDSLWVRDLQVAADGSFFVTGWFQGDFDLDGQLGNELIGDGRHDGFVAKYSADGQLAWARVLSAIPAPDANDQNFAADVFAMELTDSHVYLAGNFSGTLRFGDEPILSSTVGYEYAGFLLKLEVDQPIVTSVTQIQDAGSVMPTDLLVTTTGDSEEIFITGGFGWVGINAADGKMDTVIGGQEMHTPFTDAFLVKFQSEAGTPVLQWAHQVAATKAKKFAGSSFAHALARSAEGAIYVAGSFNYPREFGTAVITPVGMDGYVVRIDEVAGAPQMNWVRQISSSGTLQVFSMGILEGASSSLFLAGEFEGRADFDPTIDEDPQPTSTEGSYDAYLLELDAPTGDYLDLWHIGGAGSERTGIRSSWPDLQLADLVVADAGSVFLAGMSDSPQLPAMDGVLEPAGRDGILMHVNPAAPELMILPTETFLLPGQDQTFQAIATVRQGVGQPALDLSDEVNWTLYDPDGFVLDTATDSGTFTTVTPSTPGRYELKAEVTGGVLGITATYRHVFYISELPAAPSGLEADVHLAGKNSKITLRWNDESDNESGFYIEYMSDSLTGCEWVVLDRVGAGTTTYTHVVSKQAGTIWYRVRSFADLGMGEVLSPVTDVLEVNPAVGGTYTATPSASLPSSTDPAAALAVDLFFASGSFSATDEAFVF